MLKDILQILPSNNRHNFNNPVIDFVIYAVCSANTAPVIFFYIINCFK